MSEEQFKAFLEKIKGDSSLQDKIKTAMSVEEIVIIAKENGYEFAYDELNKLSEKELEGMVGGATKTRGNFDCPTMLADTCLDCSMNCTAGTNCN